MGFGCQSDSSPDTDARPPTDVYFKSLASTSHEIALDYQMRRQSSRASGLFDTSQPASPTRTSIRVAPEKSNRSSFELQFHARDLGPTDKNGSPIRPRGHAGRITLSNVSISHEGHPPAPPAARAHAGRASAQSHDFRTDGPPMEPSMRERSDGSIVHEYRSAPAQNGWRSTVEGDIQWDMQRSRQANAAEHDKLAGSQFARPKACLLYTSPSPRD